MTILFLSFMDCGTLWFRCWQIKSYSTVYTWHGSIGNRSDNRCIIFNIQAKIDWRQSKNANLGYCWTGKSTEKRSNYSLASIYSFDNPWLTFRYTMHNWLTYDVFFCESLGVFAYAVSCNDPNVLSERKCRIVSIRHNELQ